jgi:CubicO group peptidase (beta-lactamase class C family)
VQIDDGFRYGYQWYVAGAGRRRWVGGMGNGGQRLLVFPDLDLVVAITAGNYNTGDPGTSSAIVDDVVLASID